MVLALARPRLELLAGHAAVLFVDIMTVRPRHPERSRGARSTTIRLLRGIPRLRFAPLGMTEQI
jgi:hypothetical protein